MHMKHSLFILALVTAPFLSATAQFGGIRINPRAMQAGKDALGAVTLSDEQVKGYAKEAVTWMDEHNAVAKAKDPYAVRLTKLFGKHTAEDGLALNFKVYKVKDVNAFACADGSVRVFSALMDLMTDDEILAVIGHEIGHVKNEDTKDAMKAELKRSAFINAAAVKPGVVSQLAHSDLSKLADGILGASYSRKQESQADDYGYDFLKRHNYPVLAMAGAFEKLQKLSDGATPGMTEKLMSSHPDSGKRAKNIRDRAKKDGLDK
jgi:metalloprotease